jgi:hypothetical protein
MVEDSVCTAPPDSGCGGMTADTGADAIAECWSGVTDAVPRTLHMTVIDLVPSRDKDCSINRRKRKPHASTAGVDN